MKAAAFKVGDRFRIEHPYLRTTSGIVITVQQVFEDGVMTDHGYYGDDRSLRYATLVEKEDNVSAVTIKRKPVNTPIEEISIGHSSRFVAAPFSSGKISLSRNGYTSAFKASEIREFASALLQLADQVEA